MNKDQEDNLNMYQATDSVMQAHNAVWNLNVPISDAVQRLEDNIDDIENLRDIQETDITGVTLDKDNKRQELEDSTYTVGSILSFYASTVNNQKLLKKINFTRSELRNARDNELPGMSEQVHAEAVANAAAVLPFGLTAAMTAALLASLTSYVDHIARPRQALTETSAATEQLPPLFTSTTKLLEEQLDKGMELYRVSNPDFYTQYFNARIIVNSPTLTRSLQASFKDSVTNLPLEHVKVQVDLDIFRRSSELGNIRVQSLDEGPHQLKANLPGYNEVIVNFNVITGETTKLTVLLVKI
jgi:hypothetical protein